MIAAFVGNMHASARVTPFYPTHAEAREAAKKLGFLETFTREISNWAEHKKWNIERVGMYAQMPVAE